jgi:hypothetical protein
MADGLPSPDQTTLEAHLHSVRFLTGVQDGRWSVLQYAWPNLFVHVVGRDPETARTFSSDFHLECKGYPDPGPFIERWTYSAQPPFGTRPPPPGVGSPGYVEALKDWSDQNQHGGIYRVWQRFAAAHNGWAEKRPDEAWNRQREIAYLMEQLYALVSEQAAWLATRT